MMKIKYVFHDQSSPHAYFVLTWQCEQKKIIYKNLQVEALDVGGGGGGGGGGEGGLGCGEKIWGR